MKKTRKKVLSVAASLVLTAGCLTNVQALFPYSVLTAMLRHSGISMTVHANGDLHVDGHHTVEDTGIVIGQALMQALGDKSGIARYGSAYIPMDEAPSTAWLYRRRSQR